MTSDTIITEAMIAEASVIGACTGALEWLRKRPRTVGEACVRYPDWVLRHGADRLPADLLYQCAMAEPFAALRVADRLPADLLAECVRIVPWTALVYAAGRLPADLLAECARRYPRTALRHASGLLPAELLAELREARL